MSRSTQPGLQREVSVAWACPACRQPLDHQDGSLHCRHCNASWPVVNGIPHFIESAEYWGEPGLTPEIMRQITRQMETQRWAEVIRDHPEPSVRQHYRFISNLSRASWQSLVPVGEKSVVLDAGAGLGTISEALSESCARVYAMERVAERVEFMRLRFAQENCDNITIVRSDLDHLPFPDASFDLIVLNGVLEWLPFSRTQVSPRRAQLYYLCLLRKLLKPRGTLYIGVENRMSYELLAGAPDPHIGVKFVAVLPRTLAHLVCTVRLGDRYRPYLYSSRGYRRLLAEAGFQSADVFVAHPSYTDPQRIISLQEQSSHFDDAVWPTKKFLSRVVKGVLLRLDLLKYFGYAYIVLGRT